MNTWKMLLWSGTIEVGARVDVGPREGPRPRDVGLSARLDIRRIRTGLPQQAGDIMERQGAEQRVESNFFCLPNKLAKPLDESF